MIDINDSNIYTNFVNIASWGHASQSSLSRWSKDSDAQRGVIEFARFLDYAFHTGGSEAPWWKLEFPKEINVRKIRIWNRVEEKLRARANGLTVEMFNEKKQLYKKTIEDFSMNYADINLPEGIQIDTIQLTMNHACYLHLNQIEVFVSKDFYIKELSLRNKYVLCIPYGGFNDTLSQISKCWYYARQYRRTLIVDTRFSGFMDCFSNYFTPPPGVYFEDALKFKLNIKNNNFYPPHAIKEQKISYQRARSKDGYSIDKTTGKRLSFNFEFDYYEDYLLHVENRGGRNSLFFLKSCRLNNRLIEKFLHHYSNNNNYTSIHIRNTDYKTDYEDFLKHLSIEIIGNILFASDDKKCREYAREVFGERLFFFTNVPDSEGKKLHASREFHSRENNDSVIIDLLALAAGKDIHIKNLSGGGTIKPNEKRFSGFSELAKNLCHHKYYIDSILGVHLFDKLNSA